MNRIPLLSLVALVAVGACADYEPTEPQLAADGPAFARQDAPGQQRLAGVDAEFARMAREIPGFGGMYYDEGGSLNVYMTGGQLRAAEARGLGDEDVKVRVGRSLGALGRAAPAADRIVIHEGDYDFVELSTQSERMLPVLGVPGVVFTDIDERSNRLRIGIEDGVDAERVRHALQMLDVPLELVGFEVTEPIVPLSDHTLQNRQDPLAGGLQLIMPHPTPGFVRLCTLGFNVLREGRGRSQPLFFTNSHCTETRGEVKGTPFYQHSLALPNEDFRIGTEIEDPPFFTSPCFVGWVCRWSDAALVRYETSNTPVKFGSIYRTEFFGTGASAGSLSVDDADNPKFFFIRDEAPFPMLGETLNKVGRTTGWTRGPVVGTCLHIGVSGTNIAMLCQDLVLAQVAGGDSGSPVFHQDGDSQNVTLYGILWGGGGGQFVFSAMENIREEFGDFRTH